VRKTQAGSPVEMGFPPIYRAGKPRLNVVNVSVAVPLIARHCKSS
jgi:hypothetical protein